MSGSDVGIEELSKKRAKGETHFVSKLCVLRGVPSLWPECDIKHGYQRVGVDPKGMIQAQIPRGWVFPSYEQQEDIEYRSQLDIILGLKNINAIEGGN
jgi:hypothetical protein